MPTETEARGKLCPFIRAPNFKDNEGSVTLVYQHIKCVGSQCMAWRWGDLGPGKNAKGFCGMTMRIQYS
jgi:hypothetical protein